MRAARVGSGHPPDDGQAGPRAPERTGGTGVTRQLPRSRHAAGRRPGAAHRPEPVEPWLLLLPLVVTLYPPLYNRRTPELGGIPFFYWYQLAVISVGVACTWIVYRKTKG